MRYLFFLLLCSCFCCSDEAASKRLIVTAAQTALRQSPGDKSPLVCALSKGQAVQDLNEVSNFETLLRLGHEDQQSPWLKVQTDNGQQGWLFGAAVAPPQHADQWLFQKRLLCYFGPSLAAVCDAAHQIPGDIPDEIALARAYRKSVWLRDTLLYILEHRPNTGESDFQPDFTWLSEAVPGCIFQLTAGSTQPGLFTDYRFWRTLATRTKGEQDDLFFNFCCAISPPDSIESVAPVWKFQVSAREVVSRLGEGWHLKTLQAMDQIMDRTPCFQPEWTGLKNQILEDIFGKNTAYWQPRDKIIAELKQMIQSDLRCLTPREREELSLRCAMFADPDANGIRVNLRAGDASF